MHKGEHGAKAIQKWVNKNLLVTHPPSLKMDVGPGWVCGNYFPCTPTLSC